MLARIALKQAARRCSLTPAVQTVQTMTKSTVSGEEYLAQSKEPYTVRQQAKGRFVSPHVDIYDFPVAAIASVTTRFTGMGLTAGFYGCAAYALVGGDVPALLDSFKAAAPALVLAGSKFVVGFPIAYHWLSGVRHMVIDHNPHILNNDSIEVSSKAILGLGVAAGIMMSIPYGTQV